MKKYWKLLSIFLILFFSFVFSACERSGELGEFEVEDLRPTAELLSAFDRLGVMLNYDDQMAEVESVQWLSASEIPGQHDWMGSAPFIRIDFSQPDGTIFLSRVGDQQQVSAFAQQSLYRLNDLIQKKSRTIDGCIPVLPYATFFTFCDHQEFKSNLDFVAFDGGEGIRFVTAYAVQQFVPINNETIEYSYQALSSDKQYYLSAHFDIRHEVLSESDWGVPEGMFEDLLGDDFDIYSQLKMDQLENNSILFSPSLEVLDTFIQSLSLEKIN